MAGWVSRLLCCVVVLTDHHVAVRPAGRDRGERSTPRRGPRPFPPTAPGKTCTGACTLFHFASRQSSVSLPCSLSLSLALTLALHLHHSYSFFFHPMWLILPLLMSLPVLLFCFAHVPSSPLPFSFSLFFPLLLVSLSLTLAVSFFSLSLSLLSPRVSLSRSWFLLYPMFMFLYSPLNHL